MKRTYLSLAIALSLTATTFMGVSAKPNNINASGLERAKVVEKFKKLNNGKLKLDLHENKGLHVFAGGKLSEKREISGDSALAFLEENKALLGLTNTSDNFKVSKVEKDELGFTSVRLNQLIAGNPVKGKEIIVHFDKNGYITNITGSVEDKVNTITKLGTDSITKDEAIEIAKNEFTFNTLRKAAKAEKQVVTIDDAAYEVYNVNIQYNDPEITNYDVLVETSSGKVVEKINNIKEDGAATGTGTAVDGSTKPLNLYLSSTTYQMKDTTKPMTGQILTYTASNRQVEPGTLVTNTTSNFNTTTLKAAVSAHYHAGVVYDFYKNLFNRNSINNSGMSIISTVHYGRAYNNAFWDGTQMVYGDGDGTTFTYLSGDLDVVGHELTHGVTEYTANLNYENQPGALNESMSDVFGVLIQTYDKYNVKGGGAWAFNAADWVVGDAVYTPATPGDALRSLANPNLYDQPATMSEYVNTTSDYGGVHTNSGIPNKAAFLVAQAIGCDKTAKIYYRGLTNYMTATTDFVGAKNALVQAAADLYGATSAETAAVENAFTTVGVGSTTPPANNDPYEPNDTLAQAYAAASGTTYNGYISTSTDVDLFKISAVSGGTITISLTGLPADYDLYLYDQNGKQVARSYNAGTTAESISYKALYSGVYYIDVVGYNGALNNSTPYALKATY